MASQGPNQNGVQEEEILSDSSDRGESTEDDEDSNADELCDEPEEGDGSGLYVCLFCDEWEHCAEALFRHMDLAHSFKLLEYRAAFKMRQLDFIKMVNWLRYMKGKQQNHVKVEVPKSANVEIVDINKVSELLNSLTLRLSSLESSSALGASLDAILPWKANEFWLEICQDNGDPLLTFMFEDDEEYGNGKYSDAETINVADLKEAIGKQMPSLLEYLPEELTSETLADYLVDLFGQYKIALSTARSVVLSEDLKKRSQEISYDNGASTTSSKNNLVKRNDELYFESYDEFDIHNEMIQDKIRTKTYRHAIISNDVDFQGKSVLDVGCGTGILSLFCAEAGAQTVVGVDSSKIVHYAVQIAHDNDKLGVVKFIQAKLEDIDPSKLGQFDILISEFMGYFLVFERMMNTFLYARDKFLKPGGKLFPNKANIYLVGVSDSLSYDDEVKCWNNVYGYRMDPMRKLSLSTTRIDYVDPKTICSEEVLLRHFDLETCPASERMYVNGSYTLNITKSCRLTAFCGYFNTKFSAGSKYEYEISTSPSSPETHWQQTIFYLAEPLNVFKGETVPFTFQCEPHADNERSLQFEVSITHKEQRFEQRFEMS